MVAEYYVCDVADLADRGRRVVRCGDTEVGVFRIGDEIHAWLNRCAHMRGPVCQGRIFRRVLEPVAGDGTVRMLRHSETEIHIVCPWHGYEYDLRTGAHPGNPRIRLRRVAHRVEDGRIYVTV